MMKLACLLLVLTPALATADKTFTHSASWDCTKDPVVRINHGGGSYHVKGACKEIDINGGDVKLAAEDVDVLNINGGSCKVTVGAAGTINVNGASNKVSWKKAKAGDQPQVNIQGADNDVAQAK